MVYVLPVILATAFDLPIYSMNLNSTGFHFNFNYQTKTMTDTDSQVGLTETEALALIAAVQLAATITDRDLIRVDAVNAAKRLQKSLGKNTVLYNYIEVGWEILEASRL